MFEEYFYKINNYFRKYENKRIKNMNKMKIYLKVETTSKRRKILLLLFILFCVIFSKKYNSNKYLKPTIISNTYRLAVIFGTRPEAIKLIPLIKEFNLNKKFSCITINTGQHKEMTHQILKSFGLEDSINFNLETMEKNQSLTKLTSKIIIYFCIYFLVISQNHSNYALIKYKILPI